MKRLLALALALPFALLSAGPTAAFTVLSESGPHGAYSLTDTPETPGAKCTYGDVVYSNWAYLVSMKVFAPHVFAADSPYLDSDAVFGVKPDLVRDFAVVEDPARAAELGLPDRFREVEFDVVLLHAEE